MMVSTASTFTLISALIAGSAYSPLLQDVRIEPIPAQAIADIRRARVEIYCGHNTQAVADIGAARRCLRASSTTLPREMLATLDHAAWLARHDHYRLAEEALDAALAQIA
jgi:hypothetical protein